ncbi:MAG TPA: hypothetical protein VNW46_16675 [Gemmatimonadaceae bacterium]|jgi:hypothetical protein|nr:hypothetical protein [Gemmatimonadaceae bacterium]
METTVRDLTRAIVRHFVLAVLGAVLTAALFTVATRLTPTSPLRDLVPPLLMISAIVTYYHFAEFRGKTRRYFNQRHRAANELLRADFRRRV